MGSFATTGAHAATVNVGQSYVVNLPKIETYPPLSPAAVMWYQGTQAVSGDRFYISLKYQLVILEAMLPDSGLEFRAHVRNIYGTTVGEDPTKYSPKFQLHVVGK